MRIALSLFLLLSSLTAQSPTGYARLAGKEDRHGYVYVRSGGLKLHYAAAGQGGPLVIMLHGFPDFWWTWRGLMPELAKDHHVVALDMRGYNLSDKPEGVASYAMKELVADVVATVGHFGYEKAIVVGHDWGGAVAWGVAMARPELVERLVILNLPHPRCLVRELRDNPEQWKNSQYARAFQVPGAHLLLNPGMLSRWVKDEKAVAVYRRAFERSDYKAMLSYYKANYPGSRKELAGSHEAAGPVSCPVLMMHGLDDKALLPGALNDTWKWVERDLTITTVPGAGHFVQHDAPELVRRGVSSWLRRDGPPTGSTALMKEVVNERCPFTEKPPIPTSLFRYQGRVVGFASHEYRDMFASDPARHAAAMPALRGR